MATYRVEMEGDCREVYEVEADSEAEAMANWADGVHVITEVMGSSPVYARVVED